MYNSSTTYNNDILNTINGIHNPTKLFGKRILITGATGLLGGFLVDVLLMLNRYQGYNISVWALGRSRERLESRFISHLSDDNLNFLIQDVTEPIEVDEEFDYIFHFAGDGYPEAFAIRPVETMTPALFGTYHLLQKARKNKECVFLMVSTGEIYGVVSSSKPIKEDEYGYVDIGKTRSCYPSSKRAAETMCAAFGEEYGCNTIIARLSHVYGGCTSNKDNRATAQFIERAVNGEDIILHSAGLQLRSYTYVADAVLGILFAILCGQNGEAYNVANPKSRVTISEFARVTAEVGGVDCIFDCELDGNSTPISYAVLDTEKIERLGYVARYSIEAGIRNSLLIQREVGNG